MKPVDALGCLIGESEPTHLIGFCGPNTSDPRLALRSFSLMPNQPTFEAGEAYYFVAVGNSSDKKFSSHLCENLGMRIRIHVMAKNADIQVERVEEDTKKLLAREQQKADLELVHEYNRQIHLGRIRIDSKADDKGERSRESYEDNQSTPDKHLRRKTDDTELDYSGRGKLNGQRHNGHQIRHHSKPADTDPPLQFRPIASDPYSLPSRTIGYDYVIGYEETSGATSLMFHIGFAFLLPFCWILLR
ncbi:hypothetical protein M3Y97_00989700 [Aphelenchoides bicaudatus]|nr:hypothetical protein M3Y97_00989700 [Aphelenchoides bicaudatus]